MAERANGAPAKLTEDHDQVQRRRSGPRRSLPAVEGLVPERMASWSTIDSIFWINSSGITLS